MQAVLSILAQSGVASVQGRGAEDEAPPGPDFALWEAGFDPTDGPIFGSETGSPGALTRDPGNEITPFAVWAPPGLVPVAAEVEGQASAAEAPLAPPLPLPDGPDSAPTPTEDVAAGLLSGPPTFAAGGPAGPGIAPDPLGSRAGWEPFPRPDPMAAGVTPVPSDGSAAPADGPTDPGSIKDPSQGDQSGPPGATTPERVDTAASPPDPAEAPLSEDAPQTPLAVSLPQPAMFRAGDRGAAALAGRARLMVGAGGPAETAKEPMGGSSPGADARIGPSGERVPGLGPVWQAFDAEAEPAGSLSGEAGKAVLAGPFVRMAGLADTLGLPAADPDLTGPEGAVASGPVRQDRAPVVPQEQPAGPGLVPGGQPQGRPVAASGLLSASRDAAPSPDPEAVTPQDSAWTGQVLSLPPGALDALASGAGRPGYSPAEALWLLKSEALPAANPVLSGGLTIPAPEPGPARAGGAIAPGADLGLPDPADEGPALPVMSPAPLLAQPGLPAPQLPAALPSLPQLAAAMIDSLARRPDGVTEIALSPAELGQVRLTLQSDADNPARMVVLLSFDRPETMDLFRRHADQLAEALRAAGFTDTRIGFGQHGADQTPFGQGGRDQRQGGRPDLKHRSPLLPEQHPDAWPGHPALRLSTSASLDLRL